MTLNPYVHINRIEFSVTDACTSRCKHCSVGDVLGEKKIGINKDAAVAVVAELSEIYAIESVMTFGGEPLLFADTTCAIHKAASEKGIPKRQIITNGYFSKDNERILSVAKGLKESGVNSLMLSVDAFHDEYVPFDKLYLFVKAVCSENISGFKLHPAWVVNREHENKYNVETEMSLSRFADLLIPVSNGNTIFPSGNAATFLAEFYDKKPFDLNMKCGIVPYTEKLNHIETISIRSNGDVNACCFVIGNIYRDSIIDIIKGYNPYENPMIAILMSGGVAKLLKHAEEKGIVVDPAQFYSACCVCRHIGKALVG